MFDERVRGDWTGVLRALRVPPNTGLTGKVFQAGRAEWVDDYFGSQEITHDFDRHIATEKVRRVLAVPLLREGEPLGVLAVGPREDGTFGDREIEHVSAIAAQAALAVSVAERARLSREIAVHEERRRLAADLHDSVGALLFAIGSGMADLAESTQADPELRARLDRLQRQAMDATTALRESLRTLRSSPAALALGRRHRVGAAKQSLADDRRARRRRGAAPGSQARTRPHQHHGGTRPAGRFRPRRVRSGRWHDLAGPPAMLTRTQTWIDGVAAQLQRYPDMVVVGRAGTAAAAAAVCAAGACGILVKHAGGTAVRDAIRSVAFHTGTPTTATASVNDAPSPPPPACANAAGGPILCHRRQ